MSRIRRTGRGVFAASLRGRTHHNKQNNNSDEHCGSELENQKWGRTLTLICLSGSDRFPQTSCRGKKTWWLNFPNGYIIVMLWMENYPTMNGGLHMNAISSIIFLSDALHLTSQKLIVQLAEILRSFVCAGM